VKTISFGKPYLALGLASAEGVADAWNEHYGDGEHGPEKAAIGERLKQLRPEAPASIDVMAETIGNKTWTHPTCEACDKSVMAVVIFGDGRFGTNQTKICKECLTAGLGLLERHAL
jgi:hypothetical protein